MVNLYLRQPPGERVPARMPRPAQAVHLGLPAALRHARRLGGERGSRLAQVSEQVGGGPARAGLDRVGAGLLARILRGHHAGPRPDEQVTQPVRIAGNVREDMPAAPAGQQRRLSRLAVGEPFRGGQQAVRRVSQLALQLGGIVHPWRSHPSLARVIILAYGLSGRNPGTAAAPGGQAPAALAGFRGNVGHRAPAEKPGAAVARKRPEPR